MSRLKTVALPVLIWLYAAGGIVTYSHAINHINAACALSDQAPECHFVVSVGAAICWPLYWSVDLQKPQNP